MADYYGAEGGNQEGRKIGVKFNKLEFLKLLSRVLIFLFSKKKEGYALDDIDVAKILLP